MKGARGLVSLVILVWSVLASGSALASASPTVLAGEHQVAIAVWSVPLTPRGHVSRSLVYFAEAERFGNAATGEQVRALSAVERCAARKSGGETQVRCEQVSAASGPIPEGGFAFDFGAGRADLLYRHDGMVDRVAWRAEPFVSALERGDWGQSTTCSGVFPTFGYGYSSGPSSGPTLAAGVVHGDRLRPGQLGFAWIGDEAGAFVEDDDLPQVLPFFLCPIVA